MFTTSARPDWFYLLCSIMNPDIIRNRSLIIRAGLYFGEYISGRITILGIPAAK